MRFGGSIAVQISLSVDRGEIGLIGPNEMARPPCLTVSPLLHPGAARSTSRARTTHAAPHVGQVRHRADLPGRRAMPQHDSAGKTAGGPALLRGGVLLDGCAVRRREAPRGLGSAGDERLQLLPVSRSGCRDVAVWFQKMVGLAQALITGRGWCCSTSRPPGADTRDRRAGPGDPADTRAFDLTILLVGTICRHNGSVRPAVCARLTADRRRPTAGSTQPGGDRGIPEQAVAVS
jgi:hypothetical protein